MSLGPEQIINSLWTNNKQTLYELCSSGKSGALFYYTKDKNYMLKSIAGREFKKLFEILRDYTEYCQAHPDTLMTKFFGMYRLEWRDPTDTSCMATPVVSYLIVMQNLFRALDCGIRFDLKGSTQSRTRLKHGQTIYENRDINVSLKDNDFTHHMQKINIVESLKPDMPQLKDVLSADVEFLTRNNLIDYSFLLGEVQ